MGLRDQGKNVVFLNLFFSFGLELAKREFPEGSKLTEIWIFDGSGKKQSGVKLLRHNYMGVRQNSRKYVTQYTCKSNTLLVLGFCLIFSQNLCKAQSTIIWKRYFCLNTKFYLLKCCEFWQLYWDIVLSYSNTYEFRTLISISFICWDEEGFSLLRSYLIYIEVVKAKSSFEVISLPKQCHHLSYNLFEAVSWWRRWRN